MGSVTELLCVSETCLTLLGAHWRVSDVSGTVIACERRIRVSEGKWHRSGAGFAEGRSGGRRVFESLGGSGERCQEGPPRTAGPTRASSRRRHPRSVAPGQARAIVEPSDRDGRRPSGPRGGVQIAHGDDRHFISWRDADLSNIRCLSAIREGAYPRADGCRSRRCPGTRPDRRAAQGDRCGEGTSHPTDGRGGNPEN
jgi:hypothetical protein